MEVYLLYSSPLWLGASGARTCWDSHDKSDSFNIEYALADTTNHMAVYEHEIKTYCGEKDAELLDRVGNKFKHKSILEHLVYTFEIKDVSRALLQELSRHRIASPSVKSTRYTLKELKEESSFITASDDLQYPSVNLYRAKKYLVFTDNWDVDYASILALENLRKLIISGVSNDIAKYCLPESYKTELQWTVNARSLQNFLLLRSDKSALWEIQKLAREIFDKLPEDHKYLFTDYIKVTNE